MNCAAHRRYAVIIVGAGPAGSVAATLLAQAGWDVALLEKQRFPRRKVCGECIAASNLPLLDALGVERAITLSAGPELRRVGVLCGARGIEAALPVGTTGRHAWGRALSRERLDALLLDRARAAGAVIHQPCTVVSVARTPGEHLCEVIATEGARETGYELCALTMRAPVVLAAHGSWQPLPGERAAYRHRLRGGDLLAFKANFTGAAMEPGLLRVLCFPGGYGGMVLADHGLTTVACCIRADQLALYRARAAARTAGAVVEAYLQDQCPAVREALQPAVRIGPWLAAGPIRPGVRLDPSDPPVFRIGNAAGEAHPIIGEGISMALQSAWLLCNQLLQHPGVLDGNGRARRLQRRIQRRYAYEWRSQFGMRLRLASVFAHSAMHPALWTPGLALLHRAPQLLTRAARWSGKIRCAVSVPA